MSDVSRVRIAVERITPDAARTMLRHVYGSGRVDPLSRDACARDMKAGAWLMNGSTIVLAVDGAVLDGRARLHACIDSGSTFETLVVRGVEATTFETIDALRKRTLGDILAIRKERHGRPLASALRIIWSYRSGCTPGTGQGPGPTTLLSLLEQAPLIRDSIMPGLRATPLLPHGCAIALHHLASSVSPVKATQFMNALQEPTSSAPDDPATQLRAALIQLREQGGERKQTYLLAIAIKALNAFLANKPVKLLRFTRAEKFPRLQTSEDWGPLSQAADGTKRDRDPPKSVSVRAHVTVITPDMAEKYLDGRAPNRLVSSATLNKYARDMASGRWRLNGQTIKISTDGRLIDGQHRLEAAKKSRTTFTAIVVEGLDPGILSTIDIGRKLSMNEILRERGESNTIVFASALRWLWIIENDVILSPNSSPSSGELIEIMERRPQIRSSLKRINHVREVMGGGLAAALHTTFADKDQDRADEFFDRLSDGANLGSDSPILHLRERLLRARASPRLRTAEAERLGLSLKAWNTYRLGRPMQVLAWRTRGTRREYLQQPI